MNYEMEMRVERRMAAEQGRAEGLAEGRAKGLAEGRAEGRTEGLAEGLAEGLSKGEKRALLRVISAKVEKGKGLAQIASELETAEEDIKELYEAVIDHPGLLPDEILKIMSNPQAVPRA